MHYQPQARAPLARADLLFSRRKGGDGRGSVHPRPRMHAPALTPPPPPPHPPARRWLAPEVLQGGQAGLPCDVWAFGTVMWELLTWQMPFAGLNPFQVGGVWVGE